MKDTVKDIGRILAFSAERNLVVIRASHCLADLAGDNPESVEIVSLVSSSWEDISPSFQVAQAFTYKWIDGQQPQGPIRRKGLQYIKQEAFLGAVKQIAGSQIEQFITGWQESQPGWLTRDTSLFLLQTNQGVEPRAYPTLTLLNHLHTMSILAALILPAAPNSTFYREHERFITEIHARRLAGAYHEYNQQATKALAQTKTLV